MRVYVHTHILFKMCVTFPYVGCNLKHKYATCVAFKQAIGLRGMLARAADGQTFV